MSEWQEEISLPVPIKESDEKPKQLVADLCPEAWELAKSDDAIKELANAVLADQMIRGNEKAALAAARAVLNQFKGAAVKIENVDKKLEVVLKRDGWQNKVVDVVAEDGEAEKA